MLSAIATLVLFLFMVISPLLIPIAVTVSSRISNRRHRGKTIPKPRLRIKHGFEQLSTSH